ncbi:hypothetical protein B0H19DRAFT_1383439 [Mycena capillaripes]|nr:hypothetical protein B0H19DRAFT_1383439 [Mycena capillaripes]
MAPVVIPGIDVPLLTGPLVLGYMWGYCLYGMLIVQVYLYSEMFPKDRIGIKALVYSLFLMETVFTIFTTIAAWDAYGPGWGDTDTLLKIDWSWEPLPEFNGVLATMAQSFYIWRIWTLTKSIWTPILIGCVMLTQMTAAFYFGIKVSLEGLGVDKLFALSPEITLWLAGDAACDVFITVALVYIFSRQKRATKFQQTNGLINKLIRFSIETGTVTTSAALTHLILWLTCRQWNIHFIFFLTLGKLYSNVLVATLNSRATMFRSDSTVVTGRQTGLWLEAPGVNNVGSRMGVNVQVSRATNASIGHNTIVMNRFDAEDDRNEGQDKSYPELAV